MDEIPEGQFNGLGLVRAILGEADQLGLAARFRNGDWSSVRSGDRGILFDLVWMRGSGIPC